MNKSPFFMGKSTINPLQKSPLIHGIPLGFSSPRHPIVAADCRLDLCHQRRSRAQNGYVLNCEIMGFEPEKPRKTQQNWMDRISSISHWDPWINPVQDQAILNSGDVPVLDLSPRLRSQHTKCCHADFVKSPPWCRCYPKKQSVSSGRWLGNPRSHGFSWNSPASQWPWYGHMSLILTQIQVE